MLHKVLQRNICRSRGPAHKINILPRKMMPQLIRVSRTTGSAPTLVARTPVRFSSTTTSHTLRHQVGQVRQRVVFAKSHPSMPTMRITNQKSCSKSSFSKKPSYLFARSSVRALSFSKPQFFEHIPQSTLTDLTWALRSGDFRILDVRSEEDHKIFSPSGAISFPLENIKELSQELPRDRHLYIFCDAAEHFPPIEPEEKPTRSLLAADYLIKEGFRASVVKANAYGFVDRGFLFHEDEEKHAALLEKKKKEEEEAKNKK